MNWNQPPDFGDKAADRCGIRQTCPQPRRQNQDIPPTYRCRRWSRPGDREFFKHGAEIIEVAGTRPATTPGGGPSASISPESVLRSMARYDFRSPRLFVAAPLGAGLTVTLDAAQIHYLVSVLRMAAGDSVLVFNGADGEWKAALARAAKREAILLVETMTRPQPEPASLHYLFSPLKRARLDYMVQKAVEMGVSRLHPVIMRHTQAERVNLDRMRANAIEAAEQCGILAVPQIAAPLDFAAAIAALEPSCHLVFCDEDAPCGDPVAALRADLGMVGEADRKRAGLAVLVGPEGGFAEEERATLLGRPRTSRVALGPRILRADTAAVAALAVVQTAVGDWR
jgi:16S rRNA (uracil1498-N3)-methyltransferase